MCSMCLFDCRRRAWVVQGFPPKEGPWAQRPVYLILLGSAGGSGLQVTLGVLGHLRFLLRFRWVDSLAASPLCLEVLVVLLMWLAMSKVRVRSSVDSVMVGQMSVVNRRDSVVVVVRRSVSENCLACVFI